MKSLEARIAGDQLIEEKIFPKKHFVVCSIITFFLFSLPSIYLSICGPYILHTSHLIQTIEFSEWL